LSSVLAHAPVQQLPPRQVPDAQTSAAEWLAAVAQAPLESFGTQLVPSQYCAAVQSAPLEQLLPPVVPPVPPPLEHAIPRMIQTKERIAALPSRRMVASNPLGRTTISSEERQDVKVGRKEVENSMSKIETKSLLRDVYLGVHVQR
jgi:hypothetical protein